MGQSSPNKNNNDSRMRLENGDNDDALWSGTNKNRDCDDYEDLDFSRVTTSMSIFKKKPAFKELLPSSSSLMISESERDSSADEKEEEEETVFDSTKLLSSG